MMSTTWPIRHACGSLTAPPRRSPDCEGRVSPSSSSPTNRGSRAATSRPPSTRPCAHGSTRCSTPRARRSTRRTIVRTITDLGLDASRAAFVGDRWADLAAAATFGGLALLVPSADTPPADVARARAEGALTATLAEAVDRIVEALR
jgi:hypothetical protein